MISQDYKDYINDLAPVGVLKQALHLYEKQTREFIIYGEVDNQTLEEIFYFNEWCYENDYKNSLVFPLKYKSKRS